MKKYTFFLLLIFISCGHKDPQNYKSKDDLIIELKEAINYIRFNENTESNKVLCIDGYSAVLIDSLYWMTTNLNTDTFANGKKIPEVRDMSEWYHLKSAAWCYYNNDSKMGEKYGKLYNWYAVSDTNCLCPKNWKVASLKDWNKIVEFYGGTYAAVHALNSEAGWGESRNGSNRSSLNILPGGYRPTFDTAEDDKIDFYGLSGAVYWTSTMEPLLFGFIQRNLAWGIDIGSENTYIAQNLFYVGQSVRCVKEVKNEKYFQ